MGWNYNNYKKHRTARDFESKHSFGSATTSNPKNNTTNNTKLQPPISNIR